VADLLGAEPNEIVFTSSGSESDNYAIRGLLEASHFQGHVVTSAIEHPAVLASCHRLQRFGVAVTALPVNSQGIELKRKEPTAGHSPQRVSPPIPLLTTNH
jgi:cysteine desulfurase